MSKGLKALENIKHYDTRVGLHEEDYKTIEKALKRLEQLEEEKQSFDRQLEKKLKALEIIKKKKVFVAWLKHDLSTYNNTCALYNLPRLNEEEFNLLKEVGL